MSHLSAFVDIVSRKLLRSPSHPSYYFCTTFGPFVVFKIICYVLKSRSDGRHQKGNTWMLGLVLGNLSIPGCSLYAANHLNLSKRRNSLDRLGFFLFQEGIYEDLANKAGFVDYSVSWPRRGKPVNTCNFETPFKKDCYYIPSKFVLPARIWAVCKSGFFFKDASMPRAFEKSRRARWGSHLMFENKYRPLLTKDT